ncbi:hypothetical protein K501DRAFT_282391 [Backusella circina FSU 941]|nr:hypothetical protein K501DRAFT_282391 [Backusella circina FSU 941]
MTAVTTKHARSLGLLEKYQLSKHLTHAYGTVNVTGHLAHPACETDNVHTFYLGQLAPALTRLLHRHPLLSVVMRDIHSSSAHFAQLSSVDLSQVIRVGSAGETLEKSIHTQTSLDFDLDALLPLWCIYIVPINNTSCYLTYTVHHAISDGMGLSIFWQELLEELNNSSSVQQQENWIVQIPQDAIVASPYELSNPPALSLVKDTVPLVLNSIGSKVLPTFISKYLNPALTSWKGDFPAVDGESHNTDLLLFHVHSSEWSPLMKKAKEVGISAHAIVFACVLLAWAKVYPDDGTVETGTPMNCRPMCNPPVAKHQLGNYVGAYNAFWTNDATLRDYQKNPWLLAKKYHVDLQKNKIDGAKQSLLLKFLPDFPGSYIDFWGDKRKNSNMGRSGGIEFSDLGRFSVPSSESDPWQLKDIYFCQSAQIFTTAYSINGISANNNLYCTMTWQKGALKDEKPEQLTNAFKDVIKAFLEN